jgi:hypothetical protein
MTAPGTEEKPTVVIANGFKESGSHDRRVMFMAASEKPNF